MLFDLSCNDQLDDTPWEYEKEREDAVKWQKIDQKSDQIRGKRRLSGIKLRTATVNGMAMLGGMRVVYGQKFNR